MTGSVNIPGEIEVVAVDGLVPYARNSRTHSDEQVAQIAASIREFGFTSPVLIGADGGIIAGHGRVMAAQRLGLPSVPCIRLAHLSETQRRAYVIADNQLALNAGWDEELLQMELADLAGLEFDMGLLGFDAEEISGAMGGDDEPEDAAPKPEGINYQEKYAVLVDCESEAAQEAAFNRLTAMGFVCKVLVN